MRGEEKIFWASDSSTIQLFLLMLGGETDDDFRKFISFFSSVYEAAAHEQHFKYLDVNYDFIFKQKWDKKSSQKEKKS